MDRSCFLCGSSAPPLQLATWALPHVGARELGFGTCERCGLVLQSPTTPPEDLARWYAESAVYDHPGRGGAPHPRKVRGLTRLLAMVEHSLGRPAESAFQVGASDGYTLSRFAAAGTARVGGLEPGEASRRLARERYGLELAAGTIEDASDLPDVELWVLTHVLEHLHDPLAALRRIRERMRAAGRDAWVVVEVPLFERPDELPPGYLSFEHLTYFTAETLEETLARAGFRVVSMAKEYDDDIYPVVACMAQASEDVPLPSEVELVARRSTSRRRLEHYVERERAAWSRVDERLSDIESGARVFLRGGGVFAGQLLANTGLAERTRIEAVLDSSPEKQGCHLGPYPIHDPAAVELVAGDCVVIASHAAEQEIWDSLAAERKAGVRVVRLGDG